MLQDQTPCVIQMRVVKLAILPDIFRNLEEAADLLKTTHDRAVLTPHEDPGMFAAGQCAAEGAASGAATKGGRSGKAAR